MLRLLLNCDVYQPEHIGRMDILLVGGAISCIAPSLENWKQVPHVEVFDARGAIVCPGLVDSHVHLTGGGGEMGPASRTPELSLSDLTRNGVTTVLGLLGTDGVSRSLEHLLFKVRALEEEGVSAYMLTGNYRFPSPTLTSDVQRDVALIDKVIGCKVALADHRSSNISATELARLGSEVRIGSMLSGKAGIVVVHMGRSERLMKTLFDAVEQSDVPVSSFVPTHCCRTPELVADAVRFNKMGGTIDFTADDLSSEQGTARAVAAAVEQGAEVYRITMSSDAGGSLPRFDERGNCVGLEAASCATLLAELRRLTVLEGFPLETALRFFTKNPARVMGLSGVKGELAPGADADILMLDRDAAGGYIVKHLFAKGRLVVRDGIPVRKGMFESTR